MLDTSVHDPCVDRVEFGIRDQEFLVLHLSVYARFGELEQHALV